MVDTMVHGHNNKVNFHFLFQHKRNTLPYNSLCIVGMTKYTSSLYQTIYRTLCQINKQHARQNDFKLPSRIHGQELTTNRVCFINERVIIKMKNACGDGPHFCVCKNLYREPLSSEPLSFIAIQHTIIQSERY